MFSLYAYIPLETMWSKINVFLPVSFPFVILHVYLWIPGHHTNSNDNIALMNAMCDMSQFVVDIPVPDENSATLAINFMQHVLIKFGIRYLVVLDDNNPFKQAIIAMYQAFNLNYDILTKWNHKALY